MCWRCKSFRSILGPELLNQSLSIKIRITNPSSFGIFYSQVAINLARDICIPVYIKASPGCYVSVIVYP
jgi:hypothetical protein